MISIKRSELKLVHWFLVKADYEFIGDPTQLRRLDDQYPIQMDYHIQDVEDDQVFVMAKAEINKDKDRLPGFVLTAEGGAIFNIKEAKEKLTKEQLQHLVVMSGLNIAINHLRNNLAMMTFQSPIGPYILPAIDLGDLIDKKQKIVREKQKSDPAEEKETL